MSDERPDTAPSPVHRPRGTTATAAEEKPVEGRAWSAEAIVGAVGLFLTILGLAGHAYVLDDHVKQLESAQRDDTALHQSYTARFAAVESSAQADRAASDKREALIEQSLREISDKLGALQASVDQLPQHHH